LQVEKAGHLAVRTKCKCVEIDSVGELTILSVLPLW
jgi:hypothetical protein